ncbi:MAG: hypothetical protein ABI652_01010, partial [Acidobacteriota bacterium]
FSSRRTNSVVGSILGVITLVPYTYWRKTHAIHHATSGDLEGRDLGDIDTLTVHEYLALPPKKQLLYRIYRQLQPDQYTKLRGIIDRRMKDGRGRGAGPGPR